MKSIINYQNINKLPINYIFIFLTIYLIPNIRFLSVGENSALPGFLILFSFSFLSIKEIIICISLALLSILSLLISSNDYYANSATIQSGLISFYILVVPIILSIIIGRIFASRFKSYSNLEKVKEIKNVVYYLISIFTITGLLNYFSPALLSFFIFTGRTSFNRLTFWFTEPSQASAVILFIWFFGLQFLINKKFIRFFGSDYYVFLLLLLGLACLTSILSLPGTLILQLSFAFCLIILICFLLNFYRFLRKQKINLNLLSSLAIRPTKLIIINYLLLAIAGVVIYKLLLSETGKLSVITGLLERYGLVEGLNVAGGFRSYFAAVSVYFSVINPISLPGDWLGTFISDLQTYLQLSPLSPGDDIFQLTKNPIQVKPLGWLYFCLYDLGFIGLSIYVYFLIGSYIKNIFLGIFRVDIFYISLFVFQISILLVPVLPSTPSIFIPLILAVFLEHYSAKKINFKQHDF